MSALYKELQPVDAYKIKLHHPFSDYDRQLLTLFYQPLIGSNAISLFMMLWADAERKDEREYTHYHLMNMLTKPLNVIFEARVSLEAIGLLKTYCKKNDDSRSFIYELLSPLDAKDFFADPLLSTFLYSKIGEQAYRDIRTRFLVITEDDGFEDVSRTFLDVYTPSQTGLQYHSNGEQLSGRSKREGVPFLHSNFDFDLLRSGLTEQMVPRASLSSVPKELIEKLAFLYSLNPIDMQKVIMMALDEDLKIPEDRLRKAAAEFYKMNVAQEPPTLTKVFVQEPIKQTEELLTRDDELVHYFENTPPIDMLRDINGKEPLSVDVQLAEKLINVHGLSVGVVNVLLQYIHLRNDGKITTNYTERIASHWMNKKIETARDAMEISRKEHDQYMKWKNEGQKSTTKRRSTREEKVPDWFYKKETKQQNETPQKVENIEEERRKLLKELGVTENGVK